MFDILACNGEIYEDMGSLDRYNKLVEIVEKYVEICRLNVFVTQEIS